MFKCAECRKEFDGLGWWDIVTGASYCDEHYQRIAQPRLEQTILSVCGLKAVAFTKE